MLPATIEKAIGQPPIVTLVRSVGAELVQLQVEYELTVLSTLVSVGGNLTNFSIPFIAKQLIQEYPNETLADFKLCFQRGAMGAYGAIQRLDGVTIGLWFKDYLEEKYQAVEAKLMGEKDKPYEVQVSKDVLPIEKAGDYIEQWLDNVSKIGNPDVNPELKKPVIKSKASSYQPNPEYAILRLKEIQWMKECFNPLTGKPNENHLSFDEWCKK